MAISINWATKVISIPQSYLTNLGGSVYELDTNQFRLDLKDLEDSEEGMSFPITHNHNTALTLSGVTYARSLEIINGYTALFENGSYTVKCSGSNHNIADIKVVNSVSLIIGNSAGLIQVTSGSGLSTEQSTQLSELYKVRGLKQGVSVQVSPTKIEVDDVEISISTDGSITTMERQ